MPQIFFYHGANDKLAAAAALLSKACQQKKAVTVFIPQADLAQQLDRLLWTQPALGFTPHCRIDGPLASETPILLADRLDNPVQQQRLMNLDLDIPPGYTRFDSLIEVVGTDDADRQAARHRVRFYKEQGHDIHYFDLSEPRHG